MGRTVAGNHQTEPVDGLYTNQPQGLVGYCNLTLSSHFLNLIQF
jgi:hypothetical protein